MFAPEGWIMSDNQPADKPAELFIDVLEDTEAVVHQKAEANPSEVDVYKLFKRISVLQKRIIMLMSSSALDRYKHFVETYPEIVIRVPQKMIASYLGITPEALSRAKHEDKS